MVNVLVLYYSSYGHTEKMAKAVAAGVLEVEGAQVDLKRVPELVPEPHARDAGYRLDQDAPLAKVEDLVDYDAIIFGTPTRYGCMSSQMKNFIDQTGALWFQDKLVGKVASVFTSTATQHGGQEATILSFHTVLLHLGMVIVGLPYSFKQQMTLDEVTGCSPYGASTIAGSDGARQPSDIELAGAWFQGRHVTRIAERLVS